MIDFRDEGQDTRPGCGCLPMMGCGMFIFLSGLVGFILLCLALKGLFQ